MPKGPTTAASACAAWRATTTTRRWRRCSPGGSPPLEAERADPERDSRRRPGAGVSPTRPSSSSSTAAKASWASGSGCSTTSDSTDEIQVAALAKKFEEVFVPGRDRADPAAPRLRGAVPAPAGPRRGPPLRHHLPPPAPGDAHDQERPRRRARPRPGPPEPAAARGGQRPGPAAAPGGGARRPCRGSPTRWPCRCTPSSTGPGAGTVGSVRRRAAARRGPAWEQPSRAAAP